MTYDELQAALERHPDVSPINSSKLKRYAALLKEWNEKMNLTAISEEGAKSSKNTSWIA
jgi:16S rRNA G527 N7-methylase RsmG